MCLFLYFSSIEALLREQYRGSHLQSKFDGATVVHKVTFASPWTCFAAKMLISAEIEQCNFWYFLGDSSDLITTKTVRSGRYSDPRNSNISDFPSSSYSTGSKLNSLSEQPKPECTHIHEVQYTCARCKQTIVGHVAVSVHCILSEEQKKLDTKVLKPSESAFGNDEDCSKIPLNITCQGPGGKIFSLCKVFMCSASPRFLCYIFYQQFKAIRVTQVESDVQLEFQMHIKDTSHFFDSVNKEFLELFYAEPVEKQEEEYAALLQYTKHYTCVSKFVRNFTYTQGNFWAYCYSFCKCKKCSDCSNKFKYAFRL